jgi:undecaprenyl-diphosphatase
MRTIQKVLDIDSRISNCLALHQFSHICRFPLLALAHSGDSPLWLLITIILCLTAKSPDTHTGYRLLAGIIGAGITTTALKWAFRRERPPGSSWGFYWKHDQHALPSGHAGRTACIVAILAAQTNTFSVIALSVWMLAVGAARVSLKVHFVLDIVTGWAVGFAIGYLVCAIIP